MAHIKSFLLLVIILIMSGCSKTNDTKSLILGEWKLIQIYGPTGSTNDWFQVQNSPILTIKFNSNGEYGIAADGNTTCSGTYIFESYKSIKMNPSGCMPLGQSVETIYKLTSDTLIISNNSSTISSFNLRKDKYIRK